MTNNTQPSSQAAPTWLKPAGVTAIVLGILGFIASGAVGGGPSLEGALLAGCLNPLFFVGLPLGIYWVKRSGRGSGVALRDTQS